MTSFKELFSMYYFYCVFKEIEPSIKLTPVHTYFHEYIVSYILVRKKIIKSGTRRAIATDKSA